MKKAIKAIILATLVMSLTQFINAAAPANDHWGSAELIAGPTGSKFSTTVEATAQTCEPIHNFPDFGSQAPTKTVWYKWQAPASASYTFKVTTSYGATLSAYMMAPGVCNSAVISKPYPIAENQKYVIPGVNHHVSRVTFPAAAGAVIYIAVDGAAGEGAFLLEWDRTRYRYSTQLDSRDQGTDVVITRQGAGGIREWWFMRSTSQGVQRYGAMQFGRYGDKQLTGDFDGDGLTDFAVMRPENGNLTWWIINHGGQLLKVLPFGLETDRPIIGDYDGDGRAEIGVTRNEASGQKTWHFLSSIDGSYRTLQFGITGDDEMIGDYDGDGKTDVVVIRLTNGDYTWYILRSSDGAMQSKQFGRGGDRPQVADVDRDGKSDMIMFRTDSIYDPDTTDGNWYIINSNDPQSQVIIKKFGTKHDTPQLGDYDGDGLVDLTIYRNPGQWWTGMTTYGVTNFGFGQNNDRPMADLGVVAAFNSAP